MPPKNGKRLVVEHPIEKPKNTHCGASPHSQCFVENFLCWADTACSYRAAKLVTRGLLHKIVCFAEVGTFHRKANIPTGLFRVRGLFDTPLISVVGGPISKPFDMVNANTGRFGLVYNKP